MIVKVCGVTRPEDAVAAAGAGVDMIGLNFWPRSRRYISVDDAAAVVAAIPGDIKKVGVFVNAPSTTVIDACERLGLDLVQLHGDEDPAYARALGRAYIRAIRVGAVADLRAADAYPDATWLLLDTPSADYGGSGRSFDWSLTAELKSRGRPFLLAGGLDAENVARAVRQVRPAGVDVAGGVESAPGIKDHGKLRAFVAAAKGEAREVAS